MAFLFPEKLPGNIVKNLGLSNFNLDSFFR